MRKTILTISIMIMLMIPFVSAECTWYNPLTWWECVTDWFTSNDVPKELYREEIDKWTEKIKVYKNVTVTYECLPENVTCIEYDYYVKTFSHYKTIQKNKTFKHYIGVVILGDNVFDNKNFYYKIFNDSFVIGYHERDGAGRFSNDLCQSGTTCDIAAYKNDKGKWVIPDEEKIYQNSYKDKKVSREIDIALFKTE